MDKALADLSAGVDRLIDQRAIFGSRLAQVDTESERLKTLETTMTIAQSKIESLDVAGAITQLQSAMTLLQASQQSFAQIKKLSLFQYLCWRSVNLAAAKVFPDRVVKQIRRKDADRKSGGKGRRETIRVKLGG